MAGAAGTLVSLLVIALISAAPLTAATFVGGRMGYKGIALIAPWIGAVGFALLIGFGLAALLVSFEVAPADSGRSSATRPDAVTMATSSWTAAMLLSGYLTTIVYLIVLAVRRLPARPADAAAVF